MDSFSWNIKILTLAKCILWRKACTVFSLQSLHSLEVSSWKSESIEGALSVPVLALLHDSTYSLLGCFGSASSFEILILYEERGGGRKVS